MSHEGSDEQVNQSIEIRNQLSKRIQHENDDKVGDEKIKRKSNKKSTKKSKLKRMKKGIEQSVIDAAQKVCKNCSVKHSKITLITIEKSPNLKTTPKN